MKHHYGLYHEVLTYEAPEQAICEIPFGHVSKETLIAYLEEIVLEEMPETVTAVRIELQSESLEREQPAFHYTHGLKDHFGNCQRLFHGHRNTVDVQVNGVKRLDFEQKIAYELFNGNVHFCYWKNVVNKEEIQKASGEALPVGRYNELPSVSIEYAASQGVFKGTLPGRAVYFLEEETTVENLSIHFAKLVKSWVGEHDVVEVRAYEGIAKGSLTTL